MPMKKNILLFLSIILCTLAHAQTDSLFWFAAPEVSVEASNFDRPIYLRIIAYNQAAQVTISQPAGTMPAQVVNIPANSVQTVDLTTWIDIIENKPSNTTLNYGLKIQSTALVTMYYEVASAQCQCNPEIFVLKGQNAMGVDFFIPSQNYLDNNAGYNPQPFSSFDIVATQNNTTITITPSNAIVGHAAGVPFNITLNEGQTYSATAASGLAAQHLQGSRVVANRPIAITVKDDLLTGAPFGGCADLGGDQIVPTNLLGTEYIAMKGFLNGPGDQLFITATQNNTTITKDGVLLTTINSGQTFQVAVGGVSTYIQTSAPAYIWQLSGFGCEIGLDVLPPIVCTGSFAVGISRTTNEDLFLNLLVQNGGQGSFTVNGSSTVVTPGLFTAVPGTANQWFAAQVSLPAAQYPVGTPIFVNNATSLFQLGVIHGGAGSGTRFGYFSNFARFEANAVATSYNVCIGDTIQLFADSIPLATYAWTGPNSFSSVQQNPEITNAPVAATGNYIVTASVLGCLSVPDTVNVTVYDIDTVILPVNICPNSTYTLPDGATASATGTYVSHLTSQYGCDSVIITNLTVATASVNASNDTAICNGSSAQLNATGGLTYVWTPNTGLSSTTIANPVATPTVSTTYTVSSQVQTGTNGIVNGNFNAGNTAFSSSYNYTTNNTTEGEYYVGPNAAAWNGGMASCGDHTTGTGNMLCVNGATAANVTIYCQTVNVTPNTDYAFSTWLMTLSPGNPAALQFSINGTLIGNVFTANNNTCIWDQFYTTWNSGASTTANICIVNQNTIAAANDFALDDINFSLVCTATDTVRVTVNNPSTTIVDTSICQGNTYTFPGGNTSTVAVNDTATLTNMNGCDSIIITNLSILPTPSTTVNADICSGESYTLPGGNSVNTAGTYTDTLTSAAGCDSIVTTNLTLLPTFATDVYDSICQGDTYILPDGSTTSTAGTYSDTLTAVNGCDSVITTYLTVHPNSAVTVLDTICNGQVYTLPDGSTVSTAGNYTTTLQNQYGCDSVITTTLTVINVLLNATVTDALCNGESNGTINATATNGLSPYTYTLNSGQNNSTGSFTALAAVSYVVIVNDTYGCADTLGATVSEPVVLASQSIPNNVSCYGQGDGTLTIAANGGTAPLSYLLNGQSNSTGAFSGLSAGSYTYTVTDANGCIDTASFTITEPNEVSINIAPDSAVMNLSEELQLSATSNYDPMAQYLWSPSVGLSCTTCPNPTVSSLTSMQYQVQVSVDINGNMCTAIDNVSVTVIPNYDLYIPNAFTPDGNGVNDYFELFGNKQAIQYLEVQIFNRIGEKIFESNDIFFKWDGKYKGVVQQPGVYVYTINTVFIDGHRKEIYKGGITLIR